MPNFKIVPFLWYAKEAEEAARFYCSIFPDSRVSSVTTMPADSPAGPAGSVVVVDFTLCGQRFQAMTAGPLDDFNHAVSFAIQCADQAEIDRYWKLLGEGGTYEECGWVRDRYGLAWQVVPTVLDEMMRSPDKEAGRRASEAMLKMKKLDIAALERAFRGEKAA